MKFSRKAECLKSILTCLLLMLPFTQARAQFNPMHSVDSQLRAFFAPLCHPNPGPGFLIDMAGHTLDSVEFTDNNPDTINRDVWFKIYEEMRNCAYDTTSMITYDSVFALGAKVHKDTVTMNMLAYDYLRFNDSALSSNYYFTVDTNTQIITENGSPCELNPYLTQRVFASCPLTYYLGYKNTTFKVDPAMIFHDAPNDFFSNVWTLQIDFGDGSGYHNFNTSAVTYYQVTYPAAGPVYIKTRVLDGPVVIMSSIAVAIATDIQKFTPSYSRQIGNVSVSFYEECDASGGPLEKTLLYIEGFDPEDVVGVFGDRDASDIYGEMIRGGKLDELKNFGYKIAIVTWNNSRRDIVDNGLDLVEVLKELKCDMVVSGDSGTDQQFVIVAESMGGLAARYALTFLEQNWQTAGGCLAEKMHNTRLLITFDTPHKGANIPIAIQHLYRSTSFFLFGANTLTQFLAGKVTGALLDAKSVKQMLLYHVDTYNPFTHEYKEHSNKTDFDDLLADQGNYPQFCKMVAMSNGSLKGIGQTHFYDTVQRTPNDFLLDLNSNQYLRLFGNDVQLLGTNFEMRTTPNGSGPLATNTIDFYKPKIFFQIKKWKLKIVVESRYWFNIGATSSGINMRPYDVMPGSVENYNDKLITQDYQPSGLAFVSLFGLNHASYDAGSHSWHVDNFYGGGKFGFGRSVDMHTDGMHYCFIPTFSALDYANSSYWENIEDENVATIMSKTPFDVITGITEDYPYGRFTKGFNYPAFPSTDVEIDYNVRRYNRLHLFVRTDRLGEWVNGERTPDGFRYLPCGEGESGHTKFFLNREIGDDSLLIENRTTAWRCIYDAERYIGVNERSNYYAYPSSTNSLTFPGVYSREDSLWIGYNTPIILMTRDTNEIHYPVQYDGRIIRDSIAWVKCCEASTASFKTGTNIPGAADLDVDSRFIVYPNPVSDNELNIVYPAQEDKSTRLVIYDMTGRKMMDKIYSENVNGQSHYKLTIEKGRYPAGNYIVILKNGINTFRQTVIIK